MPNPSLRADSSSDVRTKQFIIIPVRSSETADWLPSARSAFAGLPAASLPGASPHPCVGKGWQATPLVAVPTAPNAPPLTALERRALDLGLLDARRKIRSTRIARILRLLFGLKAPSPLADPRLEALRRLAMDGMAPDHGEDMQLAPALIQAAWRYLGRDSDAGPLSSARTTAAGTAAVP